MNAAKWFLLLVLLSLGSYRLTRVVNADSWPPAAKFREWVITRFGPDSAWADYIQCHWCFGTWVAVAAVGATEIWVTDLPFHWGYWAGAVACLVGLIGENLDG